LALPFKIDRAFQASTAHEPRGAVEGASGKVTFWNKIFWFIQVDIRNGNCTFNII
jgi:hypothetical protein